MKFESELDFILTLFLLEYSQFSQTFQPMISISDTLNEPILPSLTLVTASAFYLQNFLNHFTNVILWTIWILHYIISLSVDSLPTIVISCWLPVSKLSLTIKEVLFLVRSLIMMLFFTQFWVPSCTLSTLKSLLLFYICWNLLYGFVVVDIVYVLSYRLS